MDMNFILELNTRRKFVFTNGHVIFCLLHKDTNDDVFDNFLNISDHFPKISEEFPKLFQTPDEPIQTFYEHFPKIAKVFRGRTDDI